MGKYHQVLAAIAGSFGSLIGGLLFVWPSYTISRLTDQNTTILSVPMTEMQSSLLGSLPPLGAMVGTLLASFIIDTLGRRLGGLALIIPYLLSWGIVEVCSSSLLILIARFIGGIPPGAFLVYGPIFISEVADDSIRGALASFPMMFYCLGVLCSYLLGWFCSYHVIIWINLATCVFGAGLTLAVIESPVFLVKQKREQDALASIAQYRGASLSKIVMEEYSRLKQQLTPAVELLPLSDSEAKADITEKEKLYQENVAEAPKNMSPIKKLFVSPSSRRAFIVVGTALTLQVFMGMVAAQVYAKDLFAKAAPDLSSNFCSVLFAIVLASGSILTAVVADKAGRRVLIITASLMVSICMGSLGFLMQTNVAPPWVAAMMLLLFCFSFNLGAGTIPYVLLAEVFVPEVQSVASMLLVQWVWFLNFVLIGVFPYMIKLLGIHGLFYIFATVGVTNAVVSYFQVPETKGLSNEKIQEAFIGKQKRIIENKNDFSNEKMNDKMTL